MKAYVSSLTLPSAALEGTNPLPVFRDIWHDRDIRSDGSLLPHEMERLGYETGARVLPYTMRDRYSRERRPMKLKTIVLENEYIRATFLADYGGRLYSLRALDTGREMLFSNPIFQPANLAIRNAWFSGGIEWNVGQLGHTFTTCEPVFFGLLRDESGGDFLRMYEYERQKNTCWQIDFHLPQGSRCLQSYVKIYNDRPCSTPMYWWTNIALEETAQTRVFSATGETIFVNRRAAAEQGGESGSVFLGHADLPYMTNVMGRHADFDASYPLNSSGSGEFFFQNPAATSPWEAAAQEDGFVFFERSTLPLRYRKVFCWGTHSGGRKWADFLSEEGRGAYVEIQAGLTPTQFHGMDMPPGGVVEFLQVYGGLWADAERCREGWAESRDYVSGLIDSALPVNEVLAMEKRLAGLARQPVEALPHTGSGWGALEAKRRERAGEPTLPVSLLFPKGSLCAEQEPWLELLSNGRMPAMDIGAPPVSWMVDERWRDALEAAAECGDPTAMLHLGICLYENGEHTMSMDWWHKSTQLSPHPITYRNLACAYNQMGHGKTAIAMMEQAFRMEGGSLDLDKAFTEEYISLLLEDGQYEEAWTVFSGLPDIIKDGERVMLCAGRAAVETGRHDFVRELLNHEFSVIREGETTLTDMWFRIQAAEMAERRGVPYSPALMEEARSGLIPPAHIDMRMNADI